MCVCACVVELRSIAKKHNRSSGQYGGLVFQEKCDTRRSTSRHRTDKSERLALRASEY